MLIRIIFTLLLLNYFFVDLKSLDINEDSDEIEIYKHLFSKINSIADGIDSVQKELIIIKDRIQNLEKIISQPSNSFINNTVPNENVISTCKVSTFAHSFDNYSFGNNWIVIQRRSDGSENFYRDWNDYKNGFGNKSNEFFAGLEKIHQMTTERPHELLIIMQDYENTKRYAKYDQFEIGNEEEGYILKTFGIYTGNAGDSLSYHKGARFSTKGHDSDQHENFNCAEKFQSAWWFRTCFESNLNGCFTDINLREPKRAVACGIHWKTFRGHWYSLKSVEIMIRAK